MEGCRFALILSSIESEKNSVLVSIIRSTAFSSCAAVDCSTCVDIYGRVLRPYRLSLRSDEAVFEVKEKALTNGENV